MKRISKDKEWRCRWSATGKEQMRPKNPDALGTAWQTYRWGYTRVQWDGLKEPKTYLAEYIERAE